MDTVSLAVKTREPDGTRVARAVRRAGKIPAILYGHGMQPLALEVDRKALIQSLNTKAGENVVLDLKVEGANLKEKTCLIKAIQHNPVTDEIQHVDFAIISLTEKIVVNVPLIALNTGEALGVKEGGILDVVHHELPIECLPTQIPEKFEVNVKDMKIGDAFHVKDIAYPEGVACKLDPEEVIVALHAPKKVEEATAAEGEAAQPEVIEKGKKDEAKEGAAPAAEKTTEKAVKSEKKE